MATFTPDRALIKSVPELRVFLSLIPTSATLYLDVEGLKLSRHGTISVIAILAHPSNVVHLIDVSTLGEQTFSTASEDGETLKSVLEDSSVCKYIWDVRNDADALYFHYKVSLAGVIDIQLLENASRSDDKTYVRGLDKCVQYDLRLGFMETNRWLRTKQQIRKLMDTDIFSVRPMDPSTVQYCQNDVIHLPALCAVYMTRIKPEWLAKAKEESGHRVAEAQSPGYDPQSERKKLGPWGSGGGKRTLTVDQMCEMMEEQREEALARDIFGYDDEFEYDEYDPWDEEGPGDYEDFGALDSDWDNN